eukprot:2754966-Prymnesium_polylepis.1
MRHCELACGEHVSLWLCNVMCVHARGTGGRGRPGRAPDPTARSEDTFRGVVDRERGVDVSGAVRTAGEGVCDIRVRSRAPASPRPPR